MVSFLHIKREENGKKNDQYRDYVFNNLDKIISSYGPGNEDITVQFAAITDFVGKHYVRLFYMFSSKALKAQNS